MKLAERADLANLQPSIPEQVRNERDSGPPICLRNWGEATSLKGVTPATKTTPGVPIHAIAPHNLGTKWLKFWNYFSLPVGSVAGLLGLLSLLGMGLANNRAELIATGIALTPICILQLIVAYGLHRRKLWAWQWNWVVLAIMYVFGCGSSVPHRNITADSMGLFLLSLIFNGLCMWPNYVYWKKRRGLFVSGSRRPPMKTAWTAAGLKDTE